MPIKREFKNDLVRCVDLLKNEPYINLPEIPIPFKGYGSHYFDDGLIGDIIGKISSFFNGNARVSFSGSTGSIRCALATYRLYSQLFKNPGVIVIPPFHKSVVDSISLLLSDDDIDVFYIKPGPDDYLYDYDILIQPNINDVIKFIENDVKDNDSILVIITSPTYGGVYVNDDYVRRIKESIGHNVIMLVDNAWGLGKPNIDSFDILIRSAHKVDGGPRPLSIIITRNKSIWNYLRTAYAILETTSPMIPSLLETERIYRIHDKCNLAGVLRDVAIEFIEELKHKGLTVLNEIARSGFSVDLVQININVGNKNGYDVYKRLVDKGIIPVRMGPRAIELLVNTNLLIKYYENPGILDDLSSLVAEVIDEADYRNVDPIFSYNYNVIENREIHRCRIKYVDFNDALNKVIATSLVPYPPGIPVIIPGAVLTKNVFEYIKLIQELGGYVINIFDNKIPICE